MAMRLSFTLRHLRYFISVAECGNLTEAANRLAVTQSTVSLAISELEDSLATQLLVRHRAKGTNLTPIGAKFLVRAKEFMLQATELEDFGVDLGKSVSGELTVGCYFMLSPFFVAQILTALKESYPNLQVRLLEDRLDSLQHSLLNGLCEVAILYDVDVHPGIRKELLMTYPPYVLAREDSPLAQKGSISLADLVDQPLILIDLPHSRTYVESLAAKQDVTLTYAYRVSSIETIRSLVSHGHGLSILNQRIPLAAVTGGTDMVMVPLKGDLPPVRLILAMLEGTRVSRRAEAFMEICRTYFARMRSL